MKIKGILYLLAILSPTISYSQEQTKGIPLWSAPGLNSIKTWPQRMADWMTDTGLLTPTKK